MRNRNYPIIERNELLLSMFTSNGYNAKLIGDINQPAIVIDEDWAVPGYVHNKTYHFCNKPFGGSEIHSVHLSENPSISRSKIEELLAVSEKRKLHKIIVDFGEHELWFSNSRDNKLFFSPTEIRFFFSYQKATEAVEQLQLAGYKATIVSTSNDCSVV